MRSVMRIISMADGVCHDRVGEPDRRDSAGQDYQEVQIEKDLEKGFDYRTDNHQGGDNRA